MEEVSAACAHPAERVWTILLVEDRPLVRDVIARLLESGGYQVLQAGNGFEALTICSDHLGPLHLLLTDIAMPGMRGVELAEHVGALRPGISVIYLSGSTPKTAVPAGSNFLHKPFRRDRLLELVRGVLQPGA